MNEITADLRETHLIGTQTREYIISPHLCNALTLYSIYLTGLSWALPEFRFVRPNPLISQLLVCISGWGYVWVDNTWQRCSKGMAYLTPAGIPHAYYAVDGVCWHTCWVCYTRTDDGLLSTIDQPMLISTTPRDLATAIQGLYNEAIGHNDQLALHSWAQLVHLYAQRILKHTSGEDRLQHLWDIVNADISYPWNSQELADRAGISTEHLRRLCQQYVNASPMKHVTLIRMRHAAVLLSTDAYSVEDVAHHVGYENAFAFSTAFKRSMDISPSLYREQFRR